MLDSPTGIGRMSVQHTNHYQDIKWRNNTSFIYSQINHMEHCIQG